MAKLNLTVKAVTSKAEGKLDAFLSKYRAETITIKVNANTQNAASKLKTLQKSADKLKATLNSINVGVSGSGGKNGNNAMKQANTAFKESQAALKKLEKQKSALNAIYKDGKNTKSLNKSELGALTKQMKAIDQMMETHRTAMERYASTSGKLGVRATKNHASMLEESQRVLNKSFLSEDKYKGKVAPAKESIKQAEELATAQEKLRTSLSKMDTALTSKSKNLNAFIGKNNDINTEKFNQLKQTAANYSKEYEQLTKQADAFKTKIGSGKATTADIEQATRVKNRMQELTGEIDNVQKKMEHIADPIRRRGNETAAFDKIGSRLTDYYNRYETQLTKNIGLYEKWLTLTQRANSGQFASISEANREFAAFRTEARKAGVEIETFGTKLQKTFGTRIRSALSGYGVMAGTIAIADILRNTVEVDTAMTELKKVTDETDKGYADFLDNAEKRAQKLGATLTETVSATADFARLGYSVSEASNLADVSIMYSNIGDGIQDIDQASSSVISTMQGFQLEAENAIDIVDKFNEVGNRFPTTSADIGEGMRRSSAAMAAAGNDLDQSIALFTAAQEVTQDADVVGTAMKTISMRLRSTKSDMESAGIETEGMSENVSTLRDEVLALSGVDIQLSADEYKDTFTILQEMSKVWGNLSDMTRANKLIVPLHGDM